jgi:antitoxin component YwqK of YwqJK toxin-antitoxin module
MHQKINGDMFTGMFKNGLKHGEGVEFYGNGESYKGEYVNGMPEGYG